MLRTITRQILKPCRQVTAMQHRSISAPSEVGENQPPRTTNIPVMTGERGVNIVTLIGRVGRDPEQRGSEDNPVTILSVATSQSFKSPEGAYHQYTSWHRVVIFQRVLGQIIASTVQKGDKIYVRGSLIYSKLMKENQQQVTVAQVKADDVINLSQRPKKENFSDEHSETKPDFD